MNRYFFIDPSCYLITWSNNNIGFLYSKKSTFATIINKQGISLFETIHSNNCTLDKIIQGLCCKLNIDYTKNRQTIKSYIKDFIIKGFIINTDHLLNNEILQIRKQKNKFPLLSVMLTITQNCNLKCPHCYVNDHVESRKKEEIPCDKIINFINQLEQYGCLELELTGGEITTHPNIRTILKRLINSPLLVNLYTNLVFSDQNLLDLIAEVSPKAVITSLDGMENSHNLFRGNNKAFNRTIANIKYLKQKGVNVLINITISQQTKKDIKDLTSFIKDELNLSYIIAGILGKNKKYDKMKIPTNELAKLIFKYGDKKNNNLVALEKKKHTKNNGPDCGAGISRIFIDSSGDVGICPTLTKWENNSFLLGNINETSIFDIWENNSYLNGLKNIQFNCIDIETCEYSEDCEGGCRSRAFLKTENICGQDELMCEILRLKKEENAITCCNV